MYQQTFLVHAYVFFVFFILCGHYSLKFIQTLIDNLIHKVFKTFQW